VTIFKEVSWEEFTEIGEEIIHFLESRGWIKTFRLKSLDEDEEIKRIIELFEENSVIKGSVGNATIYVIPIYYYVSNVGYGYALVASLIIERESSEYIVKIYYGISDRFEVPSWEEAEKFVDEKFGGFIRLLEKAVSTGSPNATKLAELIDCRESIEFISFLYWLYGDEILNDDTIPGLHSTCFRETDFFANNKIIIIPNMILRVVRDIRSNKIFEYDYREKKFYEISPEKKIFYDALFRGYRDLLEPEAVVKEKWGNIYSVSSTEVEVDGKKVSLIVYGDYDAKDRKWYIYDIFAITCDESGENKCLVYSFRQGYIFKDIDVVEKKVFSGFRETILGYILRSRRIHEETKGHVAEEIAKIHTWEILPA
jgi:hypothetical protein